MNLQNRYFLFAHEIYEASGGWKDLIGSFLTVRQAMLEGQKNSIAHIVDIKTLEIIAVWYYDWEYSGTYGDYSELSPEYGEAAWLFDGKYLPAVED